MSSPHILVSLTLNLMWRAKTCTTSLPKDCCYWPVMCTGFLCNDDERCPGYAFHKVAARHGTGCFLTHISNP